MNQKHSPSPWNIATDRTGIKARHIMAEKYTTVCSFLTSVERNCGPAEINANARLIAASPTMLAVLQELEESAGYWGEYDVPIGIVDRIRNAIKQATGGAQ